MNPTRHLAWMLNPRLDEADLRRLVKEDRHREECLLEAVRREALTLKREHGREAALRYLTTVLPLVLCS